MPPPRSHTLYRNPQHNEAYPYGGCPPPRTQYFYTKFLYIKGVTPYKSYSQSVSFLYQSPLFRSLATSLLGGAWQEFCNPTFSKM